MVRVRDPVLGGVGAVFVVGIGDCYVYQVVDWCSGRGRHIFPLVLLRVCGGAFYFRGMQLYSVVFVLCAVTSSDSTRGSVAPTFYLTPPISASE